MKLFKKFSNKSKKIAITGMVAIVLILGGMILTSPMLDNSDPITSGEYMVSNDPIPIPETKGPEEDPFPEVKEGTQSEIESIKNFVNDTLDKVEEFIDEKNEGPESTPDSKNTGKKLGGIGLGTVFTLYVAYKFIFK